MCMTCYLLKYVIEIDILSNNVFNYVKPCKYYLKDYCVECLLEWNLIVLAYDHIGMATLPSIKRKIWFDATVAICTLDVVGFFAC